MEIHSQEEYRRAVAEIDRLEQAKEGTPEFERRMQLLAMTEAYEQTFRTSENMKGRPRPD